MSSDENMQDAEPHPSSAGNGILLEVLNLSVGSAVGDSDGVEGLSFTLQAGQTFIFLLFMLSTVLNAGYFLPVIYRAFFREPGPDPHYHHYKEAPLTMVIPLCATGLISVVLGLYPALFMDFVRVFGKF